MAPGSSHGEGRLVRIGKVAKAHGIRGEVVVVPDDPESSILYDVDEALLRTGDAEPKARSIESIRPQQGAYLVRFEGVADRTAAEGLRGQEVFLPRALLPPTEPDEFYVDDLVGLQAVTPEGKSLGKVVRLLDTGAVPVLEIEGEREWQVPLAEHFVKAVEVEAGRVVVTPPEEDEQPGGPEEAG